MKIRLNKYIAKSGVASRRKADDLIVSGKVKVNGRQIDKLGVEIDDEKDEVYVEGEKLKKEKPIIYAVYKPRGVVSTVSDKFASETIVEILPKGKRVYPVGRLDKDSEGLILVTNDGDLANLLMHPRYEHEKEYEVTVDGGTTAFKDFQNIDKLDGEKIQKFKVFDVKKREAGKIYFKIILKEGKNRQIRRMAKQAGLKVLRLKRVRIGRLKLGSLRPRKWKIVTETDII